MVSMFWMRARIEARAHKVKRALRSPGGRRATVVAAVVPDFAFDLNHINDVFGSDMVKEWFFRYVRRYLGDGKGDRWQDTRL